MPVNNKKVLFITHESSRTGAPMLLKYLIEWVKQNCSEIHIDVLTLQRGALDLEFSNLAEKYYDTSQLGFSVYNTLAIVSRKINTLKKKFGFSVNENYRQTINSRIKDNRLREIAKSGEYDVIYANSSLTIETALIIKKYSNNEVRTIANIHELNVVLELLSPEIKGLINEIDVVIAGSELVKSNLIKNWGTNPEIITVIYDFTNESIFDNFTTLKNDHKVFRVGGMGATQWRKGDDIFVHVARYIKSNYSDVAIKFTWVGGISYQNRIFLENDLKKLGLYDVVEFVGEDKNYQKYYDSFDVFLLPSREDPFPLVAIEAGLRGKPIICFENSTGISEIIINEGGFVVPYLNIEKMAEKILFYYQNPSERQKDGEINKLQFKAFTTEIICPKIISVILNK